MDRIVPGTLPSSILHLPEVPATSNESKWFAAREAALSARLDHERVAQGGEANLPAVSLQVLEALRVNA